MSTIVVFKFWTYNHLNDPFSFASVEHSKNICKPFVLESFIGKVYSGKTTGVGGDSQNTALNVA